MSTTIIIILVAVICCCCLISSSSSTITGGGVFFLGKKVSNFMSDPLGYLLGTHGAELGEACTVGADCAGYGVVMQPGNECCNGICEKKVKDYANNYYCKAEAIQPKAEGEPCSPLIHDQCIGTLECNVSGKCQRPLSEGPKPLGATCAVGADCAGYSVVMQPGNDCCNAKCTAKIQDYRGNWYCPGEAIIGKGLGESCTKAEDCQGMSIGTSPGVYCCPVGSLNATCKQKIKDRAGAYYCPDEAITDGSVGSNCNVGTDCIGHTVVGQPGTCCNPLTKKCENKIKDWAGGFYCTDRVTRRWGE